MRFCKYFRLAALFAAALLLLPNLASAQSIVTGAINGTISDPSGAVIVGASVTLTSKTTGAALTTETSSSGGYSFGLVKPGSYSLTVIQTGFKQSSQTVDVALGETAVANVKLELGSGSVTVEVTGQGLYSKLRTRIFRLASRPLRSKIFPILAAT